MALSKGTNSYATVEEADAYFADRLDVAAWSSADATQKAQALVTATAVLDDMSWLGYAISESQPLAFPRVCEYFDPKVGTMVYLDGTIVPQRIIVATFEIAYHLLNNDGLLDNTGGIESIQVGPIQLSNVEAPNVIPDHVRRAIRPLKRGNGRTWWRAN